jgi:AcrR family transcriptional regulator
MARPRSDIQKRIVLAARTRFLADGVDGASLRHIARSARTSIGMVYYYFPTKDDLFLAVVEDVYSVVLGEILPALDPSLPVQERILRMYTRIGALTDDEIQVIRLVLREALVSSARLDRIVERFQRGHLPLMFQLVFDGLGNGTFDPGIHPIVIFLAMMGLGGPGQLLRRIADGRSPVPDIPKGAQLSQQMLGIFLHGVAPRAPTTETTTKRAPKSRGDEP